MTYKNPKTIDFITPYEDRTGQNRFVTASFGGGTAGSVYSSLMPTLRSGFQVLSHRVSGSQGISTRQTDPIRQGIHTNIKTFGENLTWRISDHGFNTFHREYFTEPRSFGQPKLFRDEGIPFDDSTGKWDPVSYIQDSGDSQYPVVLYDPAWVEPDQEDGVIEPLAIRMIGTQFRAAELPFVASSIKCHLIDGNIDPVKGTDFILQSIDRYPPTEIDHLHDAQNVFYLSGAYHDPTVPESTKTFLGAYTQPAAVGLALPGYTSANFRRSALFDDSLPSPAYQVLENMSSELLSISGSGFGIVDYARNAASDTGLTDYLRKSATAGYVYEDATYDGTDSIAFGGLKR
jgi:hypothetical protein